MLSLKSLFGVATLSLSLSLLLSSVPSASACYCAIGYPSGFTPATGNGVTSWPSGAATWASPSTLFAAYGGSAGVYTNQIIDKSKATAAKGLTWDTSKNNALGNTYLIDQQFNQVAISGLPLPTSVAAVVKTDGQQTYTNSFYIPGNLTGCTFPAGSTTFQTSIQFGQYQYPSPSSAWSASNTDDVYVFTQAGSGTPAPVNVNSYHGSSQGSQIYYTNQFALSAGQNYIYIAIGNDAVPSNVGEDYGCPFVYKYSVYCNAAGTKGDPQFTGFLGQDYQIHGQSNTVYNILSTPTFQYNALFSFLESGSCRSGTLCFSHPGNYFGAVGMMIHDSAKNSTGNLLIEAGDVSSGLKVSFNSIELNPAAEHEFTFGEYTMSFPNQFEFRLESNEFNMKLENSDHFINQDVSIGGKLLQAIGEHKQMKRVNATAAMELEQQLPHGLLGQTYQFKQHSNRWKFIEGHLFDYQMDGILGKEFKYNRFQH